VLNKATECYGKIDLATELSVLRTLRSTPHISKFFLMFGSVLCVPGSIIPPSSCSLESTWKEYYP
jgi:hypothetical protein